ncbi:putative glycerol kinase 5 [Ischnura elegans]|uniref:putative glycerol kinase 5 n=1 Tax=Ischnura elegans TaxID=197161 RepID=UPI001ED8B14B|nr:putative glycerol kinase 5 [Ischnura elegans]
MSPGRGQTAEGGGADDAQRRRLVAALDVGTTTVRCHVIDEGGSAVGRAVEKVEVIYTDDGGVEIEPEGLWQSVVHVVKEALADAGVAASDVTCLGMSTQRSSFVTWDRVTGDPFHNFITWKDVRAERHAQQWNSCFTMKTIRAVSKVLHAVTGSKRFLAGSVLNITPSHVTPRLAWAMETVPKLGAAVRAMGAKQGEEGALFGTVDTWLLHRMTGRRLHVTDPSCASATGFYDPFTLDWATWALSIFSFHRDMLPRVVDTTGDAFGTTHPSVWGHPIPIRCSVSDQSASLFGSCCFSAGDLKVTMGTGAFLDLNTGTSPHASATGIYPQVAWKLGRNVTYMAEGSSNDCGGLVEWARAMDLISKPEESSAIAEGAGDSSGALFVPAFAGLQAPFNDHRAAAGFIGLRASTSKHHMVRSILEAIAFRVVQLYRVLLKEVSMEFKAIRVDGGVSRNDFICQVIADTAGIRVERSTSVESSVIGAAHLAGLSAGIWSSMEEVRAHRKVERVFEPGSRTAEATRKTMEQWLRAVDRFRGWYS